MHKKLHNLVSCTRIKGQSEAYLKEWYAEYAGLKDQKVEVAKALDELLKNGSITMKSFGNGSVSFLAAEYTPIEKPTPTIKKEEKAPEIPKKAVKTPIKKVEEPVFEEKVEEKVEEVKPKPKTVRKPRKPRAKKVVKED